MANIKSQIKRNRQNEASRVRNKAVRSELKTREKNAVAAAEAGDAERAEELLRVAQRKIDAAVSAGVIHSNTGSRRKARLTKRVHALIG